MKALSQIFVCDRCPHWLNAGRSILSLAQCRNRSALLLYNHYSAFKLSTLSLVEQKKRVYHKMTPGHLCCSKNNGLIMSSTNAHSRLNHKLPSQNYTAEQLRHSLCTNREPWRAVKMGKYAHHKSTGWGLLSDIFSSHQLPLRSFATLPRTRQLMSNKKASLYSKYSANILNDVQCLQTSAVHLTASWPPRDPYANPAVQLAPLLQVPLFQPGDEIFSPTDSDIRSAEKLFGKNMVLDLKVHKGVVNLEDLPSYHVPEVAFLGRSNVGKSSLIKAIFNNLPETRVSVSKRPGHTKVLKFYQVGRHFSLVDMPGYGVNMPKYFHRSVETYLQTRQMLTRVFFLIDGAEGMNDEDLVAIEMMEELSKPYVIVMTKIDMKSQHEILRSLLAVQSVRQQRMQGCFPQPFLISSVTRGGVGLLQAFIAYITGNLDIKGL